MSGRKDSEKAGKTARDREERREHCDRAYAAVLQLSQLGPGILQSESGAKLIATKKKEKLRKYYGQQIKEYCHQGRSGESTKKEGTDTDQ